MNRSYPKKEFTAAVRLVKVTIASGGPLPIELGGHGPPQFFEKINEFFKFTIDFLIILALWPRPPNFKPVADPLDSVTS